MCIRDRIEISDEKLIGFARQSAAIPRVWSQAWPPDRENPLQGHAAIITITEEKNDDEASEEASIISERIEEA